jgi:hypothetical protein
MHALHPPERVVVGAPNGHCAVGMPFDVDLDGQEGGRSMVLRPVELDAASDPGPGQADQCGLDDVVAVEEVIAVAPVHSDVDAAADLWKQHQTNPAVLQVHGLPDAYVLVAADAVVEGQRVHPA